MSTPEKKHPSQKAGGKRLFMLALGPALMILSPVVGLIPGPGGLIVFAAGLALTLQASQVAKHVRQSEAALAHAWALFGQGIAPAEPFPPPPQAQGSRPLTVASADEVGKERAWPD